MLNKFEEVKDYVRNLHWRINRLEKQRKALDELAHLLPCDAVPEVRKRLDDAEKGIIEDFQR